MSDSAHHHAYLIAGGSSAPAFMLLRSWEVETQANPNITLWEGQLFSVAEARGIVERAMRKPMSGDRQYFVVSFASITREAQNALLKVLEEPTGHSIFLFVTPQPHTLLPTLRSRMQPVTQSTDTTSVVDAQTFLSASITERLSMVAELLPKKQEEKNMQGMLAFLSALEIAMSKQPQRTKEGLRAIYRARTYITDRGASAKILLEQVALLVPKIQ